VYESLKEFPICPGYNSGLTWEISGTSDPDTLNNWPPAALAILHGPNERF